MSLSFCGLATKLRGLPEVPPMIHLLRTRSFAAVTLALVGAGLIAAACGSDKSTSTENPSLTPGGGRDTTTVNPPADNGTPGTPEAPTTPPGTGQMNGGPGNEGPMGTIPIGQTPPETP